MAIQILTDSTSYIDKEIIDELNIKMVSLSVKFENESFKEVDISNNKFYEMMKKNGIPISSQPAIGEIYDAMKVVIEKGDDLVCIFLSSEMSGTYSTAHLAKNMILEEFKDAKIEIIDSRSNCMQLGFSVVEAAKEAKNGKSIERVKEVAESIIKRSRFLFIPDTLEYLKKGGRIGGASALIGSLLKIIPILTVEDGKTTVFTKVRTKKKALGVMMEKMLQDIDIYGIGEVIVHNINCYDEAKEIAMQIGEKLKIAVGVCNIGPVIGLHVGPGTVGVVYYTKENVR